MNVIITRQLVCDGRIRGPQYNASPAPLWVSIRMFVCVKRYNFITVTSILKTFKRLLALPIIIPIITVNEA